MKVLITGGAGLVGTAISNLLTDHGYEVGVLSRSPKRENGITQYYWNIKRQEIDPKALANTNAIIHLAGATLNHRWSSSYKSVILSSRVESTRLLFNSLQKMDHQVETVVSASASGYYPSHLTKIYQEDDSPGKDFMSMVCLKWEEEALNFEKLGIRTVRSRIGIVLSNDGGALPEMAKPVKLGLGAALGNGKQLMSWIHIKDLARMFLHALEQPTMEGAYNFVGPRPSTNSSLTKAIAKTLGRPVLLPPVPAFALKLALGEMAEIVLRSNGLSNQKILDSNFHYQYPQLAPALHDLLP